MKVCSDLNIKPSVNCYELCMKARYCGALEEQMLEEGVVTKRSIFIKRVIQTIIISACFIIAAGLLALSIFCR